MARGLTNEEVVRRYAAASAVADMPQLAELRHKEWSVEWPQSGERVRSTESFSTILERYPGGRPRTEVTRVIGSEDHWVVTAGNTILRVAGSGDHWWGEWRVTDADGVIYAVVSLIELRDGSVYHETVYWAPPFEAPEWRAPFVERPESAAS